MHIAANGARIKPRSCDATVWHRTSRRIVWLSQVVTSLSPKKESASRKSRRQVQEELRHLREMMQAEVDVEPDEGDAEIFEREKNAALISVLDRRLSGHRGGNSLD